MSVWIFVDGGIKWELCSASRWGWWLRTRGNEVSACRVAFGFRSQIFIYPWWCLYFTFLIATVGIVREPLFLRKYASSKRYHSCVLKRNSSCNEGCLNVFKPIFSTSIFAIVFLSWSENIYDTTFSFDYMKWYTNETDSQGNNQIKGHAEVVR